MPTASAEDGLAEERQNGSSCDAAPLSRDERFVLYGVSWEFYERFLEELNDRPIRLTFDDGVLEIMSPARPHEFWKKMFARLIETLTFVLGIPVASGGSMTFKRRELLKGFEPDECYWIANEARIRACRTFDPRVDPPPDLAVEIDSTSSSVNRQSIYAAMRVPEIWRYNGERLQVLLLQADGEYAESLTSAAFPFLPMAALLPYLEIDASVDETTRLRRFADWVREQSFDVGRGG